MNHLHSTATITPPPHPVPACMLNTMQLLPPWYFAYVSHLAGVHLSTVFLSPPKSRYSSLSPGVTRSSASLHSTLFLPWERLSQLYPYHRCALRFNYQLSKTKDRISFFSVFIPLVPEIHLTLQNNFGKMINNSLKQSNVNTLKVWFPWLKN